MTGSQLKAWMDKAGKTVIDISAATKINPGTITRFIRGERCFRSTIVALERYVKETQAITAKTATG